MGRGSWLARAPATAARPPRLVRLPRPAPQNGASINGIEHKPGPPVPLRSGDHVLMGDAAFHFLLPKPGTTGAGRGPTPVAPCDRHSKSRAHDRTADTLTCGVRSCVDGAAAQGASSSSLRNEALCCQGLFTSRGSFATGTRQPALPPKTRQTTSTRISGGGTTEATWNWNTRRGKLGAETAPVVPARALQTTHRPPRTASGCTVVRGRYVVQRQST